MKRKETTFGESMRESTVLERNTYKNMPKKRNKFRSRVSNEDTKSSGITRGREEEV